MLGLSTGCFPVTILEPLQPKQPVDKPSIANKAPTPIAYSSIEDDGRYSRKQKAGQEPKFRSHPFTKPTSNTISERWKEGERRAELTYQNYREDFGWDRSWLEVATRLCRVDDGLPSWVDGHRSKRLESLGNSIVPKLAYQFFESIDQIK